MTKKGILIKIITTVFIISSFFVVPSAKAQLELGLDEVGASTSLGENTPIETAVKIINVALLFLGLIALSLVLYGGFIFMTSAGEEAKASKAKMILKNAAIGLAIILAAWGITRFVLTRLASSTGANVVNYACVVGESKDCGCGGSRICIEPGQWGPCIGSFCGSGGDSPVNCNGNPLSPICQADDDACSDDSFCNKDTCFCEKKSSFGEACNLSTEEGVCNPDANKCGSYLDCDSSSCTCFGPPVITNFSPLGGFCEEDANKSCQSNDDCILTCNNTTPNGHPGNLVTILGFNFGEYVAGESKIVFFPDAEALNPKELNPACVNTWTDKQIVVAIPDIANSGPIKIIRSDGLSDSSNDEIGPVLEDFKLNNIIRPGLCALSPDAGDLDAEIVYQGINLFNAGAYFGNYSSNVAGRNSQFNDSKGLSGTSLVPNINQGKVSSFIISNTANSYQRSNYLDFYKTQEAVSQAYISHFEPSTGRAGQYISIYGSGFSNSRALTKVYFGDIEASYEFPDVCLNSVWQDKQIIVKVPSSLEDGFHQIKIEFNDKRGTIDSRNSNPNMFLADSQAPLASNICRVKPQKGQIGTAVELWGEYFGNSGFSASVVFSRDLPVSEQIEQDGKAQKIKTSVPLGAVTGPLKVVREGIWGNSVNFEIGSCVQDSDCGIDVCCPAGTFMSGRCADSLASCYLNVPNSVFQWKFSSGFGEVDDSFTYDSCQGMAKLLGACQVGSFCPNSPGVCSPFGGANVSLGSCDHSCRSVEACSLLGADLACVYNNNLDICVSGLTCSLSSRFVYELGDREYETTRVCKALEEFKGVPHWIIETKTSCPENWTRISDDRCVDSTSTEQASCDLCSDGLSCQSIEGEGRCVSEKLCASNATCSTDNTCLANDPARCDCCCEIGQDARDCCAPLVCGGTCGADTKDDGVGLGLCMGCAIPNPSYNVNDPFSKEFLTAESDLACNCTNHSGKFCDTSVGSGACFDCSSLSKDSCIEHSGTCCFDAKTDTCRGGSGQEISSDPNSSDFGYCAYYDCYDENIGGGLGSCNVFEPKKNAPFANQSICEKSCQTGGSENFCAKLDTAEACVAEAACCFDGVSNSCTKGDRFSEEGFCARYSCSAEDPALCDETPRVDGEFLNIFTCSSTCFDNYEIEKNRPSVIEEELLPAHGAIGVCRNASLHIPFDKLMNSASFIDNIILLEERPASEGICPLGTFIASSDNLKLNRSSWLARQFSRIKTSISSILKRYNLISDTALAIELPSSGKLYCSVPADFSVINGGDNTQLRFNPKNLLSPGANHYLVVKGDVNLDHSLGVMSQEGLGMNGAGFHDLIGGYYVEGGDISFNNLRFINSFISGFSTLPKQAANNGVCLLDYVNLEPSSYLFNRADNDLNENDNNPLADSFDTVSDRDKLFTVSAYSSEGFVLNPSTGYYWDWDWSFSKDEILEIESVPGLKSNQKLVRVKEGVSDDFSNLIARVNMDRFNQPSCNSLASCACEGDNCSNNCCNIYLEGDNLVSQADIYVFMCANPWPRVNPQTLLWTPWFDNCATSPSPNCADYNYKFYYCRDSGAEGFEDDLPAMIDPAVILGSSEAKLCSEGGAPCDNLGEACGPDRDQDGVADGICVLSILKETYFFKEGAPQSGSMTELINLGDGKSLQVNWYNDSKFVYSPSSSSMGVFRLYYQKKGESLNYYKDIEPGVACHLGGDEIYLCQYVLDGLSYGEYEIRVSAMSPSKTETFLSGGKSILVRDSIAPHVPSGLNYLMEANSFPNDELDNNIIIFQWLLNTDDSKFYRLYHGLNSGLYGESFDSGDGANKMSFPIDRFSSGLHYFALSAIDDSGNESARSAELVVDIP